MPRTLLHLAAVLAFAASLSSCVTSQVIATAKGTPGPMDPANKPPTEPQPLLYALVPLVFPIDLVAWPIEFFYLQNNGPRSNPPRNGPPPPYGGSYGGYNGPGPGYGNQPPPYNGSYQEPYRPPNY